MNTGKNAWNLRHVLGIDDLSNELLDDLFARTDRLTVALEDHQDCSDESLRNRTVALLFLEPSTRTFLSFQAAAQRLGANTIITQPAATSLEKGEELADMIKVVSGYADLIVLRHSGEHTHELAAASNARIINAGDDSVEHPTQAAIDLYTIRRRIGRLDNLRLGVGYDPNKSRSIRSLCLALSKYEHNSVLMVSPPECTMRHSDKENLERRGLHVEEATDPRALLECELVYVNRFQRERYPDGLVQPDWDRLQKNYRLTAADVQGSSIRAILDPLPRVGELDEKVDHLPQAAYFEQTKCGVPLRMALLEMMFES